jgi:hypothetical protein
VDGAAGVAEVKHAVFLLIGAEDVKSDRKVCLISLSWSVLIEPEHPNKTYINGALYN